MEPRDTILRLAATHNVSRRQVLAVFEEHLGKPCRARIHYYWTGERAPDPEGAGLLCHALGLSAVECLVLYEACGIPTPDAVWAAVHGQVES